MSRELRAAWAFAAIAVSLMPMSAGAEPYLAVRTGWSCAICHVNGTGAGMRTAFGTNYAKTMFPSTMRKTGGVLAGFEPGFGENVRVGGDLRLQNRAVLQPGEDSNQFEFTEGNVYVEVVLVPDYLTFYLDEAVAPGGAGSREAFLLLQDTENQLFFKAGRMLLPFGQRIWDDDAFIRRATGFNFAAQDLGVEVAWRPGRTEAALSVTNGTNGGPENNREKQVSFIVSQAYRHYRVGASFSFNDSPSAQRAVGGVFAGVTSGRLTVLGEFDVISDDFDGDIRTNHGDSRLAYVEANVLVARGVNVKLAYDWRDPFTDVDEDEREMFRIGIEPVLSQYLQVRAFYRHRKAPPQLAEENADWLTMELHAFF